MMKPIDYESPVTTIRELLAEYLHPISATSQVLAAGESSTADAANTTEYEPYLRSVRPGLT
jgi:hypothetical protein